LTDGDTVLPPAPEGFRTGYVAILGEPNVGKSTLLNLLVGQKISIVTNTPQTTRHRILGIRTTAECQMIFVDTPGIVTPRYRLHEAMMHSVEAAQADADLVLLLIDGSDKAHSAPGENRAVGDLLRNTRSPVYLVINKVDLLPKEKLIPIMAAYAEYFAFAEIFPVSAKTGEGCEELLTFIPRRLPVHPPLYPADMLSEHSERFFVAEIIREKIFEAFREEIPYSTSVDIVDFKEGKKDEIHAEIYVERESQKGIIIGRNGAALKDIGVRARKDIEAFLGRPVNLHLFVKVREKWRESEEWLKRLGYT
jgi:GTP-binding protein Era